MEKPLKVLLVEDDLAECKAISRYVDKVDGVRLVDVTNNSTKALESVVDCIPDVVILDIELHKGHGNGLLFLEKLNAANIQFRPYILVTTNNSSQITHEHARELGADFIMAKYQEDYSAESVIDFLVSMKSTIAFKKRKQGIPDDLMTGEEKSEAVKRTVRRLNAEFDMIGISPKYIGRKYLLDAVQVAMSNERTNICHTVAKIHKKSAPSVERAMANAINVTWKTSDVIDLRKHYTAKIRTDKGTPTLTEFIFYYATKMKDDDD